MSYNINDNIITPFLEGLIKLHRNEEFIKLLHKLSEESKQNSLEAYRLFFEGYIQDLSDHSDTAKEFYEKAILVDEKFAFPLVELATILSKEKKYDKAIEYLDKADTLLPDSQYVLRGYGYVYIDSDKYDKAIEVYKKAISFDGNNSYLFYELGLVYSRLNDTVRSTECFQESLNIDETNHYSWDSLGVNFVKNEEYDRAIECFKKCISLNDKFGHAYKHLGECQVKCKNYVEAKYNFQIAYSLFEKNGSYWLSIVKKEIENVDELIKYEHLENKKGDNDDPVIFVLNKTQIDKENQNSIEERVLRNKRTFTDFIIEKPRGQKNEELFFEVLRRWNSYTPIIADNYHISKGGGYFLKTPESGIVIDPGFNFIDNFKGAGHYFYEIDKILITHAHNDHTADIESILTLLHNYNEELKGLEDFSGKDTIRSELAEGKIDITKITYEEIEKAFIVSPRRKIVDFYMSLSVQKKYSGLFDLFSRNDYRIHIIDEGDIKPLDTYINLEVIGAKHFDIISDRHSLGFALSISKNLLLIYTGDTGWDDIIASRYAKVSEKYKDRKKILIAHIGGFKDYEKDYKFEEKRNKSYYKNHLGRIGLAKINQLLAPDICFISEFGEELKGFRIKLSKIYQEAFKNNILFFPADIGLKYNFIDNKIWAINNIDYLIETLVTPDGKLKKQEKSTLGYGYISPEKVRVCDLKKDYSLHYYDMNMDFTESEIIQVLADCYNLSIR